VTTFRLEGIEPDNLLGFLALLGALRSLRHEAMAARVAWEGTPLRPHLYLREPISEGELLDRVNAGAKALAACHEFSSEDISFTRDEARRLLRENPNQLWSALMSDGAVKDDGKVSATPLCAMFGQGHQHFLQRLADIPRGALTKELQKQKKPPDLNGTAYLHAALFEPWDRKDPTESFRWDPVEDRRYALRFENPSTDKGLTVHGANRLAAVGFPLLTCVPHRLPGGIRLTPRGGGWERRRFVFRWPIWRQPATLRAILALLTHPELARGEMQAPGVAAVWQTERISVGKFFNFTRAKPVDS